ncbi:hypothetical protein N181_28795 [Sinorhizobium fredii USDA 205]|nr:hypothetical protein AOX55_0000781 [Sinorhizobium fredii CCBAU 25509]KSV80850.1 hypothetical protein N181_28795 [Sinorhizobium fredii USDA 205]
MLNCRSICPTVTKFRIGINLGDVMIDAGNLYATRSISRRGLKASPSLAAWRFRLLFTTIVDHWGTT